MVRILVLFIAHILPVLFCSAQELKRAALLEAVIGNSINGSPRLIKFVRKGSLTYKTGLRAGDTVVSLNKINLTDENAYRRSYQSLKAGANAIITVLRNGNKQDFLIPVLEKPLEDYKNASVEYSAVKTTDGITVRTIITKPLNKPKPPVLIFIQALSCGSIEIPSDSNARSGDARLIADLIEQSGFAVVRTEKPGIGDSEGPVCRDCDFLTEVNAHRATLGYIKSRKDLDTDNIFIFGSSLGACIAPLLTKDSGVKGVIASGGYIKTWYEHMLEIERRRLELSGKTASQANALIPSYALFYTEYLLNKKKPSQIIKENSALKNIWYDEPEHQYGRPAAFYMQLQDVNFYSAWEEMNASALIIYGEYDWIMTKEDHLLMAKTLNARRPGTAEFVLRPKMSHDFYIHPSLQDCYNDTNGTYDRGVAQIMIEWLKRISKASY